ncbi:MAG: M23 family metallopeptidase, partial [Candidatus Riflebacteria bacterium]|nr:M23 family metallopeptidase [Candidatus Riflebacteria bacterium]
MNYFTWLLSVVFLFNPLITIAEEVIWPLKIDISQSSSFAEFRGMRFHAGLDLRTQQKNGFPVVAIADGFISRASVQFRGYGYALYIDHPALKTRVVYGHLQDFSGPIKEYIDHKLQKMGKRHGINDFFQSDRFPVKKGQIVALSGDSGMGPPHLHFEMRSLADEPVAPAVFGFRPADNIFPTFHAFYLEPMAHATVIDGSFLPSRYPLKGAGKGVYSLMSTPQVSGRFAMQVGISDTNGAGNRFGVEKVTLSVNDRQILQRIFHKYTYDENRQCPWVYDYFKSNQKNTGYVYNLFKWPFDTLHLSSENANWSGFLPDSDFKAGKFDFIVAAADFGNNAIKASGSLAAGKTDFSQQISAKQLVDF